MNAIHPRHVLCVLGNWDNFSGVRSLLAKSFADFTFDEQYSLLSPDARMPAAFAASARPGSASLEDDDHDAIRSHTAVAYILSPGMPPHLAIDVSSRTLRLVDSLFQHGATALKSESAGLAHGRSQWLRFANEHTAALQTGDDHSARAGLYFAWVQRPLLDDRVALQYTVGMHLLGLPDSEVDAELSFPEATRWLDLLGLYLAADQPNRPVLPGEGFRLAADGPRKIIKQHPCTRYEQDDFFFNPCGYNRLVCRRPPGSVEI